MARLAIGLLLTGLFHAHSASAEYHPSDNPSIIDGEFPCEIFESCTGLLSEEELERLSYDADCISFDEFQEGWYSSEKGLTFAERKRARHQSRLYLFAIKYDFDNDPPSYQQQSEFNWMVDSSGREYEDNYLRGEYGEASLLRSEVFFSDHCIY